MKKYVVILLVFGWLSNFIAQDTIENNNNPQCSQWLSVMHEFVKSKNYDEAYTYFEKLHQHCPDFNKAIYVDGVRIFKAKYKEEKDATKKKEYAQKIVELYNERLKLFPDPSGKVKHDKAVMMFIYKVGSEDEIYNILSNVFKNHPESFTHPKAYLALFKAQVNKYKKGEVKLEEVFDLYDDLTDHLNATIDKMTKEFEELSAKNEEDLTRSESYKKHALSVNLPAMSKVYTYMDQTLGELGDCKTLVPLYEKNFAENKNNTKWLKRAAGRLADKDCTNNNIFVKIVEELNRIEPSAKSSMYLAIRAKKSGQYKKAMDYYKHALTLTNNPYEKAKLYYSMAVLAAKKMGNKSLARTYALKALEYKPSMGAAYLLIASLYAKSANECGNTKFEKLAVYWKAAEMAEKAAKVDPTVKRKALKLAAEYRKRAPSKKEIFLNNMGGKIIKFDKCWVGGSVRVPSN